MAGYYLYHGYSYDTVPRQLNEGEHAGEYVFDATAYDPDDVEIFTLNDLSSADKHHGPRMEIWRHIYKREDDRIESCLGEGM